MAKTVVCAAALLSNAAAFAESASPSKLWVYVGTYTRGISKGIHLMHFDVAGGKLGSPQLVAETTNPSFLAIHPARPFLYAVGEMAAVDGKKGGAVKAFAIEPKTGKLTLLNQQSSQSPGPCHVSVDQTGRCLLVANYGGGSVACLPIGDDGRLGEATSFVQHEGSSVNPKRQTAPHAHSINVDPTNRFAFVPDLGTDKVVIYRLDPKQGKLAPNDPAFAATTPGAGPRHFDFHSNGRFAYVINELGCTVTAFSYDAQRGSLATLESYSTLPAGFIESNTTADVHVHPSGKFLYGSNRGHNSIAIFSVDPQSGHLKPLGHQSTEGRTPRNFGIDPSGAYLLAGNQDTDNVVLFRIDAATGGLTPTGQSVTIGAPVCIRFMRPLE